MYMPPSLEQLISSDLIVPVVAIIMISSVALVAIMGGLLIGLIKTLRGSGSKKSRQLDEEEARAFQELQRGFHKMEERLEALETIVLDRERRERVSNSIDSL